MSQFANFLHILTLVPVLLLTSIYATPVNPTHLKLATTENRFLTCTGSSRWIPMLVQLQDCKDALEYMQHAESNKQANQRFEFLAPNARPIHRLLPLQTPRVYTSGTCTVAVTMLSAYKPWDLPPDARRGPFPTSDIASLAELMRAAKAVVTTCVEGRRDAGWDAEGWSKLGIAVTVWETGSLIDRLVKSQISMNLDSLTTNGTSEA